MSVYFRTSGDIAETRSTHTILLYSKGVTDRYVESTTHPLEDLLHQINCGWSWLSQKSL